LRSSYYVRAARFASVGVRGKIRAQILECKEAAVYNQLLLLSTKMALSSATRILAFDTSSARGSIALLEGGEVRAELRWHMIQPHSILLLSSIDILLGRLGWALSDLNLVAAGIGPGSFTGIRIGIATALGFAQSLSIPFAGVSGLDALAHQAASLNGRIGVLLDAHRSQAYYAEFVGKNGRIRPYQKSSLIYVSDLERHLAGRHLYIIGELSVCGLKESKGFSSSWPRPVSVDLFLAASIGRLALSRKGRWRMGDYAIAEPMYVRAPDALRNKGRKR
jgi:tRNA threonylcarbamoyladenosine biosynthesis protein TsaB